MAGTDTGVLDPGWVPDRARKSAGASWGGEARVTTDPPTSSAIHGTHLARQAGCVFKLLCGRNTLALTAGELQQPRVGLPQLLCTAWDGGGPRGRTRPPLRQSTHFAHELLHSRSAQAATVSMGTAEANAPRRPAK